jgi:hypothetical protein
MFSEDQNDKVRVILKAVLELTEVFSGYELRGKELYLTEVHTCYKNWDKSD